jgi:SAM-dependent methyltransferase
MDGGSIEAPLEPDDEPRVVRPPVPMRNPWLDIAARDYVAHMTSPDVDQWSALNRLLAEALERVRPRTVLLPGGSTGNGLEHVDPAVTSRVAVVDINPEFLRRLVERFQNAPFVLDVQCADATGCAFDAASYDLIHAGLLFEYLEWPRLLPRLAAALCHRGTLSVVLQRPSTELTAVTQTEFTTLRRLESLFRFVDPDALIASARTAGLALETRRTEPLRTGKSFEVLFLRKSAEGRHQAS